MSRFPDAATIRAQHDLVEVAARYVELRGAGDGRYKACCPFHDERTPSFYVTDEGRFKCFSCGASGTVFDFVMRLENLSFIEAKDFLTHNVPVSPLPPRTPREKAAPHPNAWKHELARADLRPLRGSSGERYLNRRGIPLDLALEARIKFAQRWYGRASVMFPIQGADGKTLAVQGRAILGNEKRSKGPKSQGVFASPGVCFGSAMDGLAIVEAPIDALSLYQLLGIPAVATCGGGLPLWLPSACRGTVWIATDADAAGERYFEEWGATFGAAGVDAKRLRPRKKDWNDELVGQTQ